MSCCSAQVSKRGGVGTPQRLWGLVSHVLPVVQNACLKMETVLKRCPSFLPPSTSCKTFLQPHAKARQNARQNAGREGWGWWGKGGEGAGGGGVGVVGRCQMLRGGWGMVVKVCLVSKMLRCPAPASNVPGSVHW